MVPAYLPPNPFQNREKLSDNRILSPSRKNPTTTVEPVTPKVKLLIRDGQSSRRLFIYALDQEHSNYTLNQKRTP